MKRILCKLPNSGDRINDIAFSPGAGYMISEPVENDVADYFASIPGYEILEIPQPAQKTAKAVSAKTDS